MFHLPGTQGGPAQAAGRTKVAGSLAAALSKVTRVWPAVWLVPWIRRSSKPGLAVASFWSSSTSYATGVIVTPLWRAKRASALSASGLGS